MMALGMSCMWNFGNAYTSWCAFHKNQSYFKESALCAIARSSHVYVFHKSFFFLRFHEYSFKFFLSQNQIWFHETLVNGENFMLFTCLFVYFWKLRFLYFIALFVKRTSYLEFNLFFLCFSSFSQRSRTSYFFKFLNATAILKSCRILMFKLYHYEIRCRKYDLLYSLWFTLFPPS